MKKITTTCPKCGHDQRRAEYRLGQDTTCDKCRKKFPVSVLPGVEQELKEMRMDARGRWRLVWILVVVVLLVAWAARAYQVNQTNSREAAKRAQEYWGGRR